MTPSQSKKMVCVRDVTGMRRVSFSVYDVLMDLRGCTVPLMWQSKCMEMRLMVLLEVGKLCYSAK